MKKITLILLLFVTCGIQAQKDTQFFAEASKYYNEGKYEQAIASYAKIMDTNKHSAELYYNLGNAYYKSNQVAQSIYYYEKALLLAPNDTDIENNLAFANNMTIDAIEELPESVLSKTYKNTVAYFSTDQWAVLSVVFLFLFVASSIAYYFLMLPRSKRIAFITSISALSIVVFTVIFAFLQSKGQEKDRGAIVFKEEVSAQTEPNLRSESAFVLHEGTKVNVIEAFEDWKKVKLTNGETGWLLANDIKEIKEKR